MKTRAMATLILAGCLLAGAVGAQKAPGMHSAPNAAQAKKGMMADGMMTKCKAMMVEREGMMTHMRAMDATVDQLVATMDAADRDHKVEAMGAVIGALVAQRKAMREMSMNMDGQMMSHMMEHMGPGAMESMATCPMMKAMAAVAPKR